MPSKILEWKTMPITSDTSKEQYKTDLSDAEWAIIQSLIPPEKPGGQHRSVGINIEHVFHLAHKLGICFRRNHPRLVQPRLKFVFLRVCRTVSWETLST